jgi:hypothetical protein
MRALRLLAAALQRVVDRIDPHEGRYRMLFEESPLAMWVYDAQSLRFLAVNEAALRLYGYSREEFLRMSAQDIRVKKSGAPIEIETASHLVGWRGHAARLVFIQDVTERRRVERALERLNRSPPTTSSRPSAIPSPTTCARRCATSTASSSCSSASRRRRPRRPRITCTRSPRRRAGWAR